MIGVTGATGAVGSAVLGQLQWLLPREELVAVGRRLGRLSPTLRLHHAIADYERPRELQRALRRVSTLVFIASDGEPQLMERHHANILEAINATGVERVLYTSITPAAADSRFPYAQIHHRTEQQLVNLGAEIVVVRTSMFTEFFLERWGREAIASGVLALPAGAGEISFVSRGDVAEGLARLVARWPGDSLQDFTGPEANSLGAVADVLSRHAHRPVHYERLDQDTYRANLSLEPDWLVDAFATMWGEVAAGGFTTVTRELSELLGRPTRTLAATVETHQAL